MTLLTTNRSSRPKIFGTTSDSPKMTIGSKTSMCHSQDSSLLGNATKWYKTMNCRRNICLGNKLWLYLKKRSSIRSVWCSWGFRVRSLCWMRLIAFFLRPAIQSVFPNNHVFKGPPPSPSPPYTPPPSPDLLNINLASNLSQILNFMIKSATKIYRVKIISENY